MKTEKKNRFPKGNREDGMKPRLTQPSWSRMISGIFLISLILTLFSTVWPVTIAKADISGKISIADGTTIPGIRVTLSEKNQTPKITVSNENGEFSFKNLSAGTYQIKCEGDGFKTLEKKSIALTATQKLILAIQIEFSEISKSNQMTVQSGKKG